MRPMRDRMMGTAFKRMGLPLWVPPTEAYDFLRAQRWSEAIALELSEWFARVWSLAFAAGYKDAPFRAVDVGHAQRMLGKMGYDHTRRDELAAALVEGLPGLYVKGQQRRALTDWSHDEGRFGAQHG